MLKQLRIANLILIESADIPFAAGFNVLSGETGSGKSAILTALGLIAGDRTDSGVVRHGADKAFVEAIFDLDNFPELFSLLDERGIEHQPGEELIIKRELSASGKSRAFINNQSAQLELLRQVSACLFNIVGQHANQRLLTLDWHRQMLDLYAEIDGDVAIFTASWESENRLKTELQDVILQESERQKNMATCQEELNELEAAQLKEGEDVELFSEYSLLISAEELSNKVHEVYEALSGERGAALSLLHRHKNTVEQLAKLDPSLGDLSQSYQHALIEFQEIAHILRNYYSHIEHNPNRIAEINERLSAIEHLKRRYRVDSISELLAYHRKLIEKLSQLQRVDIHIEELTSQLQSLQQVNDQLAQALTMRRTEAAQRLEKDVLRELCFLNMAKAQFHCLVEKRNRSKHGDERIEFFFTPNIGEGRMSLRDYASGGELSRIMLALQTLLAGREQIPTVIFDEIDANIGGETAFSIGEKLKDIGCKHQLLCITHFPQVAKHAQHHLQISKQEITGRTVTQVTVLNQAGKKKELTRMLGGKEVL